MFIGLWNFCDDQGIHPDLPRQIKLEIFPGDDDVTLALVAGLVNELVGVGLLMRYECGGNGYLKVTGWHHQKISHSGPPKYPAPSEEQIRAFMEHSLNVHGTFRPESIRVECSRSDVSLDESIGLENVSTAFRNHGKAVPTSIEESAADERGIAFTFDTSGKGGKSWTLTAAKLAEYIGSYPELDVTAEFRKARQWCRDATKKKTTKGMPAFLTRWLNQAQNRGGSNGYSRNTQPGDGQVYRSE